MNWTCDLHYEADLNEIPHKQGVYAFFLDAINRRSVGLLGSKPPDQSTLLRARERLRARIARVCSFMASLKMSGELFDDDRAGHVRNHFHLTGSGVAHDKLGEMFGNVRLEDTLGLVKALERMPSLCQPIYVGITYHQTLRSRYMQHKTNFEVNSPNTFGGRLRQAGFEWADVGFSFFALARSELSESTLLLLEDYFQHFSKPLLSLR
jgi:hypothetical protein